LAKSPPGNTVIGFELIPHLNPEDILLINSNFQFSLIELTD